MPHFGESSKRKLATCHPKIKLICNKGIEIVDFSIITGHRTEEEQNKLYPKYTKVKFPDSKHNKFPSLGVDVAPYIKPYGTIFGNPDELEKMMQINDVSKRQAQEFVLKSYARLMGILQAIAHVNGISVRLGLDWDGDFDLLDQNFHDLGHMELA